MNDINIQRLGHDLKRRRLQLDVSLGDIQTATGVSKSTLSRLERYTGVPDADTLVTIAGWLGKPVGNYLNSNLGKIVHRADADLFEKIEAVLAADETLNDRSRDALADLMIAAVLEQSEIA